MNVVTALWAGVASAVSYRYNVTVTADPLPLLSQLQGNSDWAQNFNPTFVEASAGTGGKAGLLVRSQNCSGAAPGACVHCSGLSARLR